MLCPVEEPQRIDGETEREALDFSIVIATCDRPAQLRACLESLVRIDYQRERFEVIVADDGGSYSVEPVVAAFQGELFLRLLRQPHSGPAAVRNAGSAHARGRYLVFTDDDCRPATDWLKTLRARFSISPGAAVSGRRVNALADNIYSVSRQAVTDVAYSHFNANTEQARFASCSNLAMLADRFRAIGGFDPAFTTAEDRDFSERWHERGYAMIYAPEAVVYHAHALSLRSFLRQHFNSGRGAFRFYQARVARGAPGLKPEPGFYAKLLRYPFSERKFSRALPLLFLIVVGQIANAAGYWRERICAGDTLKL